MNYLDPNVPRGTIESYIKLLSEWNAKINLVSYKDIEELMHRHVIDSLQLKKYIKDEQEIFDIGSGAGFPGLMLSYAGVNKVNLVEKINKKAHFLMVAASLSSNKIIVHNQNIEEIHTGSCDVITARGFAGLDKIFMQTQNIYNKKTRYLLLKGKTVEEEIKNALEKWNFEYIIHQSETSEEGKILEVEHLVKNEQQSNCGSKPKRRSW